MQSSKDALKTAALQALVSGEKILCVATECMDIQRIKEVNHCTQYLEAGVAAILSLSSTENGAKEPLKEYQQKGLIDSLKELNEIVEMYHNGINKVLIGL